MDELYMSPRPRVTASKMDQFIGKNVTLIGEVQGDSISNDGTTMKLASASNGGGVVTVRLTAALNELVQGLLEVTGKVVGRDELECLAYKALPVGEVPFDFDIYNEAIELQIAYPELV